MKEARRSAGGFPIGSELPGAPVFSKSRSGGRPPARPDQLARESATKRGVSDGDDGPRLRERAPPGASCIESRRLLARWTSGGHGKECAGRRRPPIRREAVARGGAVGRADRAPGATARRSPHSLARSPAPTAKRAAHHSRRSERRPRVAARAAGGPSPARIPTASQASRHRRKPPWGDPAGVDVRRHSVPDEHDAPRRAHACAFTS